MPLMAFRKSAPAAGEQLTTELVLSNAGDGALKDGLTCSAELHEYLA